MSADGGHDRDSCVQLFARLSEYIDGELDERLCREIDGHMEGCDPCVDFVESLRHTVSLIESQEEPALPDRVRREVSEALDRLRRERSR